MFILAYVVHLSEMMALSSKIFSIQRRYSVSVQCSKVALRLLLGDLGFYNSHYWW